MNNPGKDESRARNDFSRDRDEHLRFRASLMPGESRPRLRPERERTRLPAAAINNLVERSWCAEIPDEVVEDELVEQA